MSQSLNNSISTSQDIAAYLARVKKQFTALKTIQNYQELIAQSIPLADGMGYLACVCELHTQDEEIISTLTKWRAEAITYHDEFTPSIERTKRWLRKYLLDVPDRILFLVLNRFGRPIGHLGYANALDDDCMMEVDNVIRGVADVEPGLMANAMLTLIHWAEKTLAPNGFYLKVLDDNTHAIKFYSKLHFIQESIIPLRRIERNGEFVRVARPENDTLPPDLSFIRMRFEPHS